MIDGIICIESCRHTRIDGCELTLNLIAHRRPAKANNWQHIAFEVLSEFIYEWLQIKEIDPSALRFQYWTTRLGLYVGAGNWIYALRHVRHISAHVIFFKHSKHCIFFSREVRKEGNSRRKLNRIRNMIYLISYLILHGIQIGDYDLM